MKTDRELLELAARAAGYTLTEGSRGYDEFKCKGGVKWNPLTDDGDALRLAASMRLDVRIDNAAVFVGRFHDEPTTCEKVTADGHANAARRAIVRAAAAIGESMQ